MKRKLLWRELFGCQYQHTTAKSHSSHSGENKVVFGTTQNKPIAGHIERHRESVRIFAYWPRHIKRIKARDPSLRQKHTWSSIACSALIPQTTPVVCGRHSENCRCLYRCWWRRRRRWRRRWRRKCGRLLFNAPVRQQCQKEYSHCLTLPTFCANPSTLSNEKATRCFKKFHWR